MQPSFKTIRIHARALFLVASDIHEIPFKATIGITPDFAMFLEARRFHCAEDGTHVRHE